MNDFIVSLGNEKLKGKTQTKLSRNIGMGKTKVKSWKRLELNPSCIGPR